jgi:excisionase family DNA binding protein
MPTTDFPRPLWTTDDVAHYLKVTRRTVYDLVKRHGLPALRPGGRLFRFRPAAVEAWAQREQTLETESWALPPPPPVIRRSA